MKKTNFFKLLMVGATALTLVLSSCVSKGEFNDLCKEVDAMKLSITELRSALNAVEAGNWVTNVTKNSDGNLVVAYRTGEPTTILLGSGGPGPVGFVALGENGNWYIDDKDTGIPAVGPAPKIEDGKWLWPVLKDGEIVWEAGEEAIYNAYATQANGVWTLYITDSATGELAPIVLPSGTTGITHIDLIGWLQAYNGNAAITETPVTAAADAVSGWLSPNTIFGREEAMYVYWARIGDNNINDNDEGVLPGETTPLPDNFRKEWKFAGGNDGKTVQGGARLVGPGVVLNTLGFEKKGIMVQVSPATADLTTLEGWSLQNSKNEILPIAFGKPVLFGNYLTRATKAVNSARYFVPATFDETAKYADNGKFTGSFVADRLFSFVAPDGQRRSNYEVTVAQKQIASVEGAVLNTTKGLSPDASAVVTAAGTRNQYSVSLNKEYTVNFEAAKIFSDAAGTTEILGNEGTKGASAVSSNAVVDYYLLPKTGTDVGLYDIEFSKNNTAFTVKNLPDNVTLAVFTLIVKKLGVDGKVYTEEIDIRATRATVETLIPIDSYVVKEEFPGEDYYLSAPITIDLAKMFEDLAKIPVSTTSNLENIWKGNATGAKRYTVELSIEGVNGNQWGTRFADATAAVDATTDGPVMTKTLGDEKHSITFVDAEIADNADVNKTGGAAITPPAAGLSIVYGVGADGKSIANTQPGGNGNIYDIRKLVFFPNYAYDGNGATAAGDVSPTMVLGKVHTMTIKFYDAAAAGDLLSTAKVTFTPTIPELSKMFARETATYWNSNTLNAYYREPTGAWAAANFYDTNLGAGDTNATYYGVLRNNNTAAHSNTKPYDGGFLAAGQSFDNNKSWVYYADLALASPDTKIGTTDVEDLIFTLDAEKSWVTGNTSTTPTNAVVVGLRNQTGNVQNDDAYGEPIDMKWNVGEYLGLYKYSDEEIAEQNFTMKIMSAMFEGNIVATAANAITVPFASVDGFAYVTYKDVALENYNKQAFGIFTETLSGGTVGYAYRYISKVEFSRPDTTTAYDIMKQDNQGDWVESDGQESGSAGAGNGSKGLEVPPGTIDIGEVDSNGDSVNNVKGILVLKAGNGSNRVETTIDIAVTDRFGKTLKETLPLVLTIE